MILYSKGFSV